MRNYLIAAFVAIGLTAPAAARDITYSEGGMVRDFTRAVGAANKKHEPVRILGECMSACTLWLMADNVCVAGNAVFMFHAPYIDGPKGRITDTKLAEIMLEAYPAPLRDYLRKLGGLPTPSQPIWMSGWDLIELGATDCFPLDPAPTRALD